MRYYLRLELNRAFRGRYMMIVLLVGCGLSLWHFYDYIWPLRSCVLQGSYPLSSFDRWLGGENYSFQAKIYFMFLPILCALPHSASWLFDGASGFGNQAIIRRGQRDYVRAKYLVTFLSGVAVAVLPLLFDFLITNLVVPAVCPQAGYGLSHTVIDGDDLPEKPLSGAAVALFGLHGALLSGFHDRVSLHVSCGVSAAKPALCRKTPLAHRRGVGLAGHQCAVHTPL